MTINASQGKRPIPINTAVATIRNIRTRNPAIEAAVQDLINNQNMSENQAVFTVYDNNYVFSREVDWKLDDL